jgi:hypothetical protein
MSYLVQETGDKLLLEDGTGALLLETAIVDSGYILQEIGDRILLENGSGSLLLEATVTSEPCWIETDPEWVASHWVANDCTPATTAGRLPHVRRIRGRIGGPIRRDDTDLDDEEALYILEVLT